MLETYRLFIKLTCHIFGQNYVFFIAVINIFFTVYNELPMSLFMSKLTQLTDQLDLYMNTFTV